MKAPEEKAVSTRERALLSWVQQVAPYGVFTLDTSFCVQSWNHWMEISSGLKFEAVAGKSIFALYPDLHERKLRSTFDRALAGETSLLSTALHHYLLPFSSPLPGNNETFMRQTARIMPLLSENVVCGLVIVIEDVTQREIQADVLRHQHRRDEMLSWALAHLLKSEEPRKTVRQLFFKIVENLDFDTFLLYFRDAQTGDLNLYASGGIPPDLEKGFSDYAFFSQIAEQRDLVILRQVKSGGQPEHAILRQAGIAAAAAIPLVANDRTIGLLCLATWNRETIAPAESDLLTTIAQYLATAVDREDTKLLLQKTQRELSDHAQLLENKVKERTALLEETISELELFSYTLAHDLKAPVRGMHGYCNVLLEDFGRELSPEAGEILNRLQKSSTRMLALIQDLLAFSRISRENVILSNVAVESIIADLLAVRGPEVQQAIMIKTPLHQVRAHHALLYQVFSNLIDNAIKFVPPQTKPVIHIYDEIVLRSSPSTRSSGLIFSSNPVENFPDSRSSGSESKKVRIWVTDEGIGVAPEIRQKIFGIFERGVTAEAYEGTGMGLAIVTRAMQRMGGTCGIESQTGSGSRFWIELAAGVVDQPNP